MDQSFPQAPTPLQMSMSLSISASTSPSSRSYLAERTNTLDLNRSADTISKLAEKCRESLSVVQLSSQRFDTDMECAPVIGITGCSPSLTEIPRPSPQHFTTNHVVHDESEFVHPDLSLSDCPLKLRRKKQHSEFVRQVTLTPAPAITPNQVIWAPIGPSGWINLSNTNPLHASCSTPTTSALTIPSFNNTRANAYLEPPSPILPASGITTTDTNITAFPASPPTSFQPGACIRQRTTALIQAHDITPKPFKPQSLVLPPTNSAPIIYDKTDIAEMKAGLRCVPVKLRRTQAGFVEQQESFFPSNLRVYRARKTAQPASRSSLRIKAMKGASSEAR